MTEHEFTNVDGRMDCARCSYSRSAKWHTNRVPYSSELVTESEFSVTVSSNPDETGGWPYTWLVGNDLTGEPVDGGSLGLSGVEDFDDWSDQADQALADRGWKRTGDWEVSGYYSYTQVERRTT